MHEGQLLPGSPIAKALAAIGDRWSILILREIFLGKSRFGELVECTGASRATLTKRLRALVANGILYQNPYQQRPLRVEYRLTDKGFALYDFALSIWQWEYSFSARERVALPLRLEHGLCGHAFVPEAVCSRCGCTIDIHDIGYRAGPGRKNKPSVNEGALRRSTARAADKTGFMLHFVDVVADPWTPLVLAAAFMGMRHFDDIRRELGIATNILSHRLKLLVAADVLRQVRGEEKPHRMAYRLTEKGRALIVPALALHLWGLAWLPVEKGASMVIFHNCSSAPLQMQMNCSHCHAQLKPRDVSFPRA